MDSLNESLCLQDLVAAAGGVGGVSSLSTISPSSVHHQSQLHQSHHASISTLPDTTSHMATANGASGHHIGPQHPGSALGGGLTSLSPHGHHVTTLLPPVSVGPPPPPSIGMGMTSTHHHHHLHHQHNHHLHHLNSMGASGNGSLLGTGINSGHVGGNLMVTHSRGGLLDPQQGPCSTTMHDNSGIIGAGGNSKKHRGKLAIIFVIPFLNLGSSK